MDARFVRRAAAAALPLVGLGAAHAETAWTFHHEQVLGTSLELRVHAAGAEVARAAEQAALAEFDRLDAMLSAWRADSEFSRWAQKRDAATAVSPELMEVLAAFDSWRERTGGVLNPAVESAAQLWRERTAAGDAATAEELAGVRARIAERHWALDQEQGTATRLTDTPLVLASFAKSMVAARAAQAAVDAGAHGAMVNLGGDVLVRGEMSARVDVADPRADAENDAPLDTVLVRDGALATSGGYRRTLGAGLSHLIDPRTAMPVDHVLQSTVMAHNGETAGALATAFSVLQPEESLRMAAAMPGVETLLVLADGRQLASEGWAALQAPALRSTMFAPAAHGAADAGAWNAAYELQVGLQLPRMDDARYRRPYVAVWIEDADHFPVRTLALWTQNPRWLPELKQWYRDDRIRNLSEGTDVSKTISSATRPPGQYSLKWDGRDNAGKPVKAGRYTVVVEASREHGTYQVERHEMDFNGEPAQATLTPGREVGTVSLDYRRK